jgi:hypothetical protein
MVEEGLRVAEGCPLESAGSRVGVHVAGMPRWVGVNVGITTLSVGNGVGGGKTLIAVEGLVKIWVKAPHKHRVMMITRMERISQMEIRMATNPFS